MLTLSMAFPLVDQLTGAMLGADLATVTPGRTVVLASRRRLAREASYGYVHALWWVWLADGRSVISVPPGASALVEKVSASVTTAETMLDPKVAEQLELPVDEALRFHHQPATFRVERSAWFACNAELLRTHRHSDLVRLTDDRVPAGPGIRLPIHCFPGARGPDDPGSSAYGVRADGRIVSVAYAHRNGILEDRVADLGVETSPDYRRRGYAQAVVSAVVGAITAHGGEARYGCAIDNTASAATARSVGFVPYATVLVLASRLPLR